MAYPAGIQDPMENMYMDGYDSALSPTTLFTTSGSTPFTSSTVWDSADHMTSELGAGQPSKETLKAAMESIIDLFKLEEDEGLEMEMDDYDDPPVDYADRARRTERLRLIAPALDQLWWSGSEYMVQATEKLADGSRNPKWRVPLGQSGLLDSYLRIIATEGVTQPLMIHVLRLIGNSCADTDENRALVVNQHCIPSIIALMKDTSLLPFIIPVLFNICVDYEPAQKQASESFLSKALTILLYSTTFNDNRAFLGYICKLLDLLVTQPSEVDNAPENIAVVLVNMTVDREFLADCDDFLALSTSAIAYLQHPRFQEALIKYGGLESAMKVLLFSYTRYEDSSTDNFAPANPQAGQAQTAAAQLSLMRNNMNQVLSDVSALPEFAKAFPVTSPFTSSLRRWLSSPQKQLQVCACIMLGNIARSDAACEEFVHVSKVHIPLINILNETNDIQCLHATLGFLKNLALPAKNKDELGDAGLVEALDRLWSLEGQPQVQYSSVSLIRQICIGSYPNVIRICRPLSLDVNSPAHGKTLLNLILVVFHKTSAEPIKMEIARLFTAICRTFTSPTSMEGIEDMDGRRQRFFEKHPDLGRPIAYMVSQKKWPVVRSEGWFVMALLCRCPEGAQMVADIMHDMTVFQPLVELLTGKNLVNGQPIAGSPPLGNSPSSNVSSPAAGTSVTSRDMEMQRIDRENALVLISELMKQRGAEMAPMRRTVFEDLLKGGGTMHLSYQQVRQREEYYDGGGNGDGGEGSSSASKITPAQRKAEMEKQMSDLMQGNAGQEFLG